MVELLYSIMRYQIKNIGFSSTEFPVLFMRQYCRKTTVITAQPTLAPKACQRDGLLLANSMVMRSKKTCLKQKWPVMNRFRPSATRWFLRQSKIGSCCVKLPLSSGLYIRTFPSLACPGHIWEMGDDLEIYVVCGMSKAEAVFIVKIEAWSKKKY